MSRTGEISPDSYRIPWAPTLQIKDVLQRILSLMISPDLENFLEPEIATQYATNKELFTKTAKEWVIKYAEIYI